MAPGITQLHVPQDHNNHNHIDCKEWVSIDTPQEIEHPLHNHRKHFGQAHGSFPTILRFSKLVDWGAGSHMADLILKGNFDQTETSTLESALLRHMQNQTDLNAIPDTLTTDKWKGKTKN